MNNSKIVHLDSSNFDSALSKSNQPILVDFYADWCGPCRSLAPKLDQLGNKYDGKVTIAKVDVDKNPELANRFQIRSIPALLLFNKGELSKRLQGNQATPVLESVLENVAA